MGQTPRMAEIFLEKISAGRAIRSTTMLATSHCPRFLDGDLYRSAVRNKPAMARNDGGARLSEKLGALYFS